MRGVPLTGAVVAAALGLLAAAAAAPAEQPVVLHPSASAQLGRTFYVSAVDGDTIALTADPNMPTTKPRETLLGVWGGSGPVAWVRSPRVYDAALAARRVYWNWYADVPAGFASELWTATWPGGRAKRLLHLRAPLLYELEGDRTLTVFARRTSTERVGGSLWRLDGTRMHRIRLEREKIRIHDVDQGRALIGTRTRMEKDTRRLEVVDGGGRLLASWRLPEASLGVCSARLSGNRVVVGRMDGGGKLVKIQVYRLPGGALSATWPVEVSGLGGCRSLGGSPYGSLTSYVTGDEGADVLHLLDVDTGLDRIATVGHGDSPTSAALTEAGLFYTVAADRGQVGFVPLVQVRRALGR